MAGSDEMAPGLVASWKSCPPSIVEHEVVCRLMLLPTQQPESCVQAQTRANMAMPAATMAGHYAAAYWRRSRRTWWCEVELRRVTMSEY